MEVHNTLTPENVNRWYSEFIELNSKHELPQLTLMRALQAFQKLQSTSEEPLENKKLNKIEIRTLSAVEALLDLFSVLVSQMDLKDAPDLRNLPDQSREVTPSGATMQSWYNRSIDAAGKDLIGKIITVEELAKYCLEALSDVFSANPWEKNIGNVLKALAVSNAACKQWSIDIRKIL